MTEIPLKVCTRCHAAKSLDAFTKQAASKDGRRANCRECVRTYDTVRAAKLAAREVINVPKAKRRPACGRTKSPDAFARNRTRLDGLQGHCKPCDAPNKAKRNAANRFTDREGCNAYTRTRRAFGPAERAAQWAMLVNGAGVRNSARYAWSTDVDDYVPFAVACHARYDASARRATKAAA